MWPASRTDCSLASPRRIDPGSKRGLYSSSCGHRRVNKHFPWLIYRNTSSHFLKSVQGLCTGHDTVFYLSPTDTDSCLRVFSKYFIPLDRSRRERSCPWMMGFYSFRTNSCPDCPVTTWDRSHKSSSFAAGNYLTEMSENSRQPDRQTAKAVSRNDTLGMKHKTFGLSSDSGLICFRKLYGKEIKT